MAKSYCQKHYRRWKTHGDPLREPYPKSKLPYCYRDGCKNMRISNTNKLCRKHFAEYNRKRRAADPSIVRRENLKVKYGITIEEYDAMLIAQNGVCAICFDPPGKKKRLSVDHDEATGRVRGLLCGPCNTGIGLLRHDFEIVGNALGYLR